MAEPAPARSDRVRVVAGHFGRDVRRQRARLTTGMVCAVVYALARVVEPWPLKVVFDQVLFHRPARGLLLRPFTIFGTSATELLAAAGLALTLAGLVRGVAYYYEDYLLSTAAQDIVYRIRARLYRHLHRLPLSFHQRRPTGDLLVRLSADIILLRDVLIDSVVNVGTGLILLLMMLGVMLYVDPVLTGVSVGVIPLVLVLTTYYGRRIRVNSKRQRRQEGHVAAAMHEALAAMDVVQLHGAGGREQERFHDLNRRSLKHGTRAVRLEARMNRGIELAIAGATVVVLWVGTLRALHGALSPGELVVFISYLRAAYRPVRRASKSVQRSAKALAAAERIVEVLDTEPDLTDAPDAVEAPAFEGHVAFECVGFAYDRGRPVLAEISVEVEPGRTLAIVGETGSGKSTLVSLVPRLFDPVGGAVRIDGSDVRSFTLDSLRAQVSVVRQESVLFGLTLAENIRYGAPDATDEEVHAAAAAAGLAEVAASLPDGYDTVVSERGASLSGGERQRVAVARALVRRTPILILDEPTTGLDPTHQEGLVATLRELAQRPTTLLVTHDLRLVRAADEIVVLDGGRVAGRGRYDELLASSPAFRRLVEAEERVGSRRSRPTPRRPADGPRVLFYSHNGVGVGHLQRQLDLADAYRTRNPDAAVLVATGSHAASMFEFPDGIDFVKLPSLAMTDRYRNWRPRDLPLRRNDVVQLRTELLEQTVAAFAPDLLVADFMPAGPYGELLPALELLARRGGAAVAGFRDVIDEPEFVRELWEETGVYDTLRDHYDAICVYGDPKAVDFVDAYGFDGDLAGRLEYCGYLGRAPRRADELMPHRRPFVVATCGGGVDGARLIETFVEAAGPLAQSRGGTFLAVTGPLMPHDEHRRLARLARAEGVELRRVVADLRDHLAVADCIVAMPGYNTACDVLSFRRPAILMPRRGPSQEQIIRGSRLEDWRCTRLLPEPDAARLRAFIVDALEGPPPAAAPVPLDGVERACRTLDLVVRKAVPAPLTS